jgi:S-adenosylmethionine:tRNA ribosyltransferase-isomerase
MKDLSISAFDYLLPPDQIADFPLPQRDASRLLVYRDNSIEDFHFGQLPDFLPQNASLVLNDTRVIEARLLFRKESGGTIEIFCLEPERPAGMIGAMAETVSAEWRCLIGGASKWKPGLVLEKDLHVDGIQVILHARFLAKEADSFRVGFSWTGSVSFAAVLHAAGQIPLPPYIKRTPDAADTERYQTVFAHQKGSVAAPTAALHFTPSVFAELAEKGIETGYVTLHVGAGTFMPVKSETIGEHPMHAEHFTVTLDFLERLAAAETIVAVGTTSLRTLESLYWLGVKVKQGQTDLVLGQWEAYELPGDATYRETLLCLVDHLRAMGKSELDCRTSLLILPGYRIKSARALITNFHQPKSTLLLLVAAFIGPNWKKVYDHALRSGYRFLSFGDSSLLWREESAR